MNKNESKYFNTARKMDEALIALMSEKDFEFITVKDICGMAEVNRSTFYLHYETIQDLLSETMEYLNDKFLSYFDESTEVVSKISKLPLENLVLVKENYLKPYLLFIQENRMVFTAAFVRPGAMQSDKRYESLYRYVIDPIMSRFQIPEELRSYYTAFFMHGSLAVIREWLKNGCRESPEEVSKIIESFCSREK